MLSALHFVFASSSFSKKPAKPGLYSVTSWHILCILLPLQVYGTITQEWHNKDLSAQGYQRVNCTPDLHRITEN